jgi:FkbM family methyltransferase
MRHLLHKLHNLTKILLLPRGIHLKLTHSNFNWENLQLTHALASAGINPDTILDVGAHRGEFAIAALTTYPKARVHAFEPLPLPFQTLQRLHKKYPNLTPHQAALSNQRAECEIRITSATQSSSLLPLHPNHTTAYPHIFETGATHNTTAVPLSEIWDSLNCAGSVLLKIDTQGTEFQILQGALPHFPNIHHILIETATRPMYHHQTLFPEITTFLKTHNFDFQFPFHLHFAASGAPTQFDALYSNTKFQ